MAQSERTMPAVIAAQVLDRLTIARERPFLLGIGGAQGSGKSTLAAGLAERLAAEHVPAAILSLDDLYKTKHAREALARDVHPLLATRGVPGTHDLALAFAALEAIARGEDTRFPRFDKATDDRAPVSAWEYVPAQTRVVILEGWCVGARPLAEPVGAPINDLERVEDADGRWRRYVGRALAADYQRLFQRLDMLVLLAAPGFDVVLRWRTEQEHALRQRTAGGLSDAALARFVQHYERLTRHILATMPDDADIVFRLDDQRVVQDIVIGGQGARRPA